MTLRIVLADDDPDIRAIARAALRRSQCEVVLASTGDEALALAAGEQPDLVLLDWMMPGMDGPETCRRLKADPATRHIPVIFLTAKSKEAELRSGVADGALGYITKPFNALTLGDAIRGMLGR